jgi:hypothetical protein
MTILLTSLLCGLCVLCALCVNSSFSIQLLPSTVDFPILSYFHE